MTIYRPFFGIARLGRELGCIMRFPVFEKFTRIFNCRIRDVDEIRRGYARSCGLSFLASIVPVYDIVAKTMANI